MTEDPSRQRDGTTHTFQAEVSRLLELMIHSVYTEREIFLRELISNASDACDKLRYEAIANPALMGSEPRLAITVTADKEKGRLTIADTGVGMTKAELIENLGTIARSGTHAFLDRIGSAGEGGALIGQFGVGFYSAFMVATAIEVVSRKAGSDETWIWRSEGIGGFEVLPAPEARGLAAGRGSEVTLTLKDDALSFLEAGEIERIVKTYSDHILFPVELATDDGKRRQLNSASALWQRQRAQVKTEEYKEVYQTISGQYDDPAHVLHWKAEGRQSYAVLLFVPERRPFDLFDPSRKGRIKLYVRRVFITEDAELLPSYLRFVRGVVDSEDMPLNISREMLQNNPQVAQIRRALTSRVVGDLTTLADREAEKFARIWEAFGTVIKEGIYEDTERRDDLLKLARFRSSAESGLRGLKDYVAAMRPGQSDIYFLTGESPERLAASPQIEAAKARGIEVLLLSDPVDSFWTTMPLSFEGKSLKSLGKGDVDLSSIPPVNEPSEPEPEARDIGALIAAFKTSLGDQVSDVRASKRLVDSAACLVAQGHGPDRSLERLLARQQQGLGLKPILEINARHALVKAALAEQAARRPDVVHDLAQLLLDQAHILEGELPTDPATFAARLNRLVAKGLGGQ